MFRYLKKKVYGIIAERKEMRRFDKEISDYLEWWPKYRERLIQHQKNLKNNNEDKDDKNWLENHGLKW